MPINDTLSDRTRGWDKRDPSISASVWTPEERAQFFAVAQAMRDAAEQTVPLVKLTTHRVMRELYEQFIANARAYADSIPMYTPQDDHFAGVTVSAAGALLNICNAIDFGSAGARGPLVQQAPPPSRTAEVANPAHPTLLLDAPDPVCPDWAALGVKFNADIDAWTRTDANLAVGDWSPEQKALSETTVPVLKTSADDVEALGHRSSNPQIQDFATLYAVYLRAYVSALSTYTPPDVALYTTAMRTYAVVNEACLVAGD
jgi:hypothetical protein